MTTEKVKRCKRIILKPEYYRSRAIQMGETYGAWAAQVLIASKINNDNMLCKASHNSSKFFHRIEWYIEKIK